MEDKEITSINTGSQESEQQNSETQKALSLETPNQETPSQQSLSMQDVLSEIVLKFTNMVSNPDIDGLCVVSSHSTLRTMGGSGNAIEVGTMIKGIIMSYYLQLQQNQNPDIASAFLKSLSPTTPLEKQCYEFITRKSVEVIVDNNGLYVPIGEQT